MRKHANQVELVWKVVEDQRWRLYLKLGTVEVYRDQEGFRYRIRGDRNTYRSKEVFGSMGVAQLQAMRKLKVMIANEQAKLEVILTEFVPF